MSDYSALEKLAYNATPGPWTAYDTHGKRFIERVGTEDYVVSETPKRQWLRDSEYIAAANPVVVLGLIEENKAAKSELAALREELEFEKSNLRQFMHLAAVRLEMYETAKVCLAAAEQRNAELVSMLIKVRDSEVHEGRLLFDSITKLIAKPTESGASE